MAELTATDTTAANPCCAPEQQASCCEPSAKADCCGHEEGCGCDAGRPAWSHRSRPQAARLRSDVSPRSAPSRV
jgi:hypothetical protein